MMTRADAGSDERVGARRRLAEVAARFERHVDVGTACVSTRLAQREHLGVRVPGARMEALAHDATVAHDDAADERIGRSRTPAALGERDGARRGYGSSTRDATSENRRTNGDLPSPIRTLTVGPGITPGRPHVWGSRAVTAGGESHPALKKACSV